MSMTEQANEQHCLGIHRLVKVVGMAIAVCTGLSLSYNIEPFKRALKEETQLELKLQKTQTPQTLTRPRLRPPPESEYVKYYELEPLLRTGDVTTRHTNNRDSLSAYSRATVVRKGTSWFRKRRHCKETCCVENVAISLAQDVHKLINALDGKDLADSILEDWQRREHRTNPNAIKYHASNLTQEIIPCLVPGTIIFLQNDNDGIRHFWTKMRPHIKVPYLLFMAGGDADSPGSGQLFLKDPLLLKLYGTNPRFPHNAEFKQHLHKYQPTSLGLSQRHPQEKQLQPYLHYTNFANPFLDKERFDLTKHPFDFDKDIFVHFGLDGLRRPRREHLWNILCPKTKRSGSSCNHNTEGLTTHEIYRDMSHYRFGISPIGYGYDCYRTYELLLLGVIPVIEERYPESRILFEGLPVVQMPNMRNASSKQDIVDAIQNYIASDAFQNASFEKGWERLFLQYTRQQILKDAGRAKDILVDDNGRQYYQAFHYTLKDGKTNEQKNKLCSGKSCGSIDASWLDNPTPEMTEEDQVWLNHWNAEGELSRQQ